MTDFTSGADRIDLTDFGLDDIDSLAMTTTDDGVTIDLADIGGGSILLDDLTTLPDAGDFVV